MQPNEIIPFTRTKDFEFIKSLGQGACGQTVLLLDSEIQEKFVCKKFRPYSEVNRAELYERFIQEVKILLKIAHPNIVRVFNHYLYPKNFSGLIIMEYVKGETIDKWVSAHPDSINDLFLQALDVFSYIESRQILHRDIRAQNILVNTQGDLKVIDFGFGKPTHAVEDFDKSVSLNMWCDVPQEYTNGIYDYPTEIYFIGKLFDKLISDNELEDFQYTSTLRQMCQPNPQMRFDSFSSARSNLRAPEIESNFSLEEKIIYRDFAEALTETIAEIKYSTKFHSNYQIVEKRLSAAFKLFSLEEYTPNPTVVIECFIEGYKYWTSSKIPTETVRKFLQMLQALSPERKQVIFDNLMHRLSFIKKEEPPTVEVLTEDIPF